MQVWGRRAKKERGSSRTRHAMPDFLNWMNETGIYFFRVSFLFLFFSYLEAVVGVVVLDGQDVVVDGEEVSAGGHPVGQ